MTTECPKCNSVKVEPRQIYHIGKDRKKCNGCGHTFNSEGDLRLISLWAAQRAVRPEKIEEIKAVWNSPKFKTNNQKLVHLLRYCKKVEYGYTIREFAHAIFPKKMTDEHAEEHYKYLAFYALRQMFRRFRHDMENHEVLLISRRLKVKGIAKWYYYNTIEDEEGAKEYRMREARVSLGITKIAEKMQDILEMSEEERRRKVEEISEKIRQKYARREANKNKKKEKKEAKK